VRRRPLILSGVALTAAAIGVLIGVAAAGGFSGEDSAQAAVPATADGLQDLTYIQSAEHGTFRWLESGNYSLTLEGVPSSTIFLGSRPGDSTGNISNEKMFSTFAAPDANPTTTISFWDEKREMDMTFVVTIVGESWDPESGTVRYEVKPLASAPDDMPPQQRVDDLTLLIT
jgi:hypothetical protein